MTSSIPTSWDRVHPRRWCCWACGCRTERRSLTDLGCRVGMFPRGQYFCWGMRGQNLCNSERLVDVRSEVSVMSFHALECNSAMRSDLITPASDVDGCAEQYSMRCSKG